MTTKKSTGARPSGRATATAAKKPAIAKPAPKPKPTAAAPVSAPKASAAEAKGAVPKFDEGPAGQSLMTKKVLFERVKKRAVGVKGSDARIVMNALLEELGAAITEGEGVKIQPFGTLKVQRRKALPDGDLVVCKLRRKKPAPKGKDPLAEAAE